MHKCILTSCTISDVRKASSLFVSNAIGRDTGAIDLDLSLEHKLSQFQVLKENLQTRRIKFDLDGLVCLVEVTFALSN